MSEPVDRDKQLRDLIDHVEHNTDAARHCIVAVEPDHFVVTRTRAQAEFLRGALAVLRAQLVKPEPAPTPPPVTEATPTEPVEPVEPAKRGPGRPRKQTAAAPTGD